jgi:dihydrofolate reductase
MIRLIAAIDRKRGIAKNGFQPWSIPDDEAYFTKETQQYGGVVLVGSTTFKTFRGPLPNRTNYILTKDKTPIAGVELVHSLEKFLKDFQNHDVWVVGGANVFAQVLQMGKADELFLTRIEADFGCNQFFPEFNSTHKLRDQSQLHEENGFLYTYEVYVKN